MYLSKDDMVNGSVDQCAHLDGGEDVFHLIGFQCTWVIDRDSQWYDHKADGLSKI